jgi:peptidoglycan/LPS O-acetylase OafA/YrhL
MDGIRAIAMMWVVIGHAYSFSLSAGSVNLTTITNVANRPFFLLIEAGLLAVDIFFMLGGFFLAFAFLREKASGIAAFGLGVLQRALRIWPAYIIAMLFYYSLFMPTGSGMFWKKA